MLQCWRSSQVCTLQTFCGHHVEFLLSRVHSAWRSQTGTVSSLNQDHASSSICWNHFLPAWNCTDHRKVQPAAQFVWFLLVHLERHNRRTIIIQQNWFHVCNSTTMLSKHPTDMGCPIYLHPKQKQHKHWYTHNACTKCPNPSPVPFNQFTNKICCKTFVELIQVSFLRCTFNRKHAWTNCMCVKLNLLSHYDGALCNCRYNDPRLLDTETAMDETRLPKIQFKHWLEKSNQPIITQHSSSVCTTCKSCRTKCFVCFSLPPFWLENKFDQRVSWHH